MSGHAHVERHHKKRVAYPVAFLTAILATAAFDRVDDVLYNAHVVERPSWSDRAEYNPNGPDSKRVPSIGTNAGLIAGFAALMWLRRAKRHKKGEDHH
jgi:hypothetical protein